MALASHFNWIISGSKSWGNSFSWKPRLLHRHDAQRQPSDARLRRSGLEESGLKQTRSSRNRFRWGWREFGLPFFYLFGWNSKGVYFRVSVKLCRGWKYFKKGLFSFYFILITNFSHSPPQLPNLIFFCNRLQNLKLWFPSTFSSSFLFNYSPKLVKLWPR